MYVTLPSESLFDSLVETHFAFLMDEGFVFTRPVCYDGELYMAKFAVGPICQVKFALEKGDFYLYLGSTAAVQDWGDGTGHDRWHSFATMVRREDEIHPDQTSPPGQNPADYTRDVQFGNYAFALRFYLPRLVRVFRDDAPAGWWDGYEQM